MDKRRLWRGEELLSLTPKALDTLLVLVARAGQVVEKEEIFKAVWPDTFVEEVTLAQNISTLRRVLGDRSEQPTYIATVPRRGYRFLEPVQVETDLARQPLLSEQWPAGPTGHRDGSIPIEPRGRTVGTASHVFVRAGRTQVWLGLSMVLALGVLFVTLSRIRRTESPATPIVFTVAAPASTTFSTSGGFMALAPDGRTVAFVASDPGGTDRLWVRSLDSLDERPLTGTEGAFQPFWSPNGRTVAFFAHGKLRTIDVSSGSTRVITDIPDGAEPLAGTWNHDGDILFSTIRQGLFRVRATGGTAVLATPSTMQSGDLLSWPHFLPDDRHFLYVVRTGASNKTPMTTLTHGCLLSLPTKSLLRHARFAPASVSGWTLLETRVTRLKFDVKNSESF